MNHQIRAILWKNYQSLNRKEFIKELFIPMLSVLILVFAGSNKEIGSVFMELMFPIYLPSSFVGLSRQLLVEYVYEKSNKLRDIYKIMGMKLQNYRIAWFITYMIKFFIVFILLAIGLYFTQNLDALDSISLNISFFIFLIAIVCQTIFLTAFFNNEQLAGEFGSFFLTMTSFIYFIIFFSRNWYIYLIICLFPQSTFSIIVMSYISQQANFLKEDISILILNMVLILNSIIYIILYVYLEMILDTNNKKHWLYCLKKKKRNIIQDIDTQQYSQLQDIDHEEQLLQFCSISIQNLNKYYKDVHAVQNLNLQIYSQQILCILGQNGAGKTTTLNILTGLTNKSSGQISILGKDIEIEDVSNLIGYCTQENILYTEMTAQQNLEFQGRLRGLQGNSLAYECIKILEQLKIQDLANIQTGKLSGGNRRKVQLGVALMANSSIIFLDEPTASLDPVSRRAIWDILIELKQQNKTLILTTHFMDEAEYLANKIAILKKGQLVIYGTSQQIKKQLKVGYTLQLQGINTQNQLLYDSKIIKQTPEYQLIQLEQNDIFYYIKGISQLEQQNIKMRLTQNTLEDAYLKLNKESITIDKNKDNSHFVMQFTNNQNHKQILQIYGLLIKKYYCTIRSFSIMIMIILPLIFVLFSVLIGHHYLDQMDSSKLEIKFYFVSLFIIQSYSLNSSIYINTPLLERELRIRQQLKQMNCSQFSYIFSTFIGDYLISVICTITIYFILSLGYLEFYKPFLNQTFYLLLTFSLALISFSYTASFLFTTTKSANKIFPVINFLALYSLPSIISDILLIDNQYNQQFIMFFAYGSPFYALDRGLKDLHLNNDSKMITALFMQSLFYLVLFIIFERHFVLFRNNSSNDQILENQLEASELSFSYPKTNKKQLQTIDLKLQKSKILGILGPNGAGKSTLIQLITDCIKLQKGHISYANSISISACQQAEGLWEELKPQEIALVYSLIKGGCKNIQLEINSILNELSLSNLGVIKDLSGGQKRKTALAISLIGKDNILVLDEPSNGLDPISRRSLQELIKEHVQKHGSSIIVTTHDMDEAENLCDEIAIMINGDILVNEQTQELIERYGTGIELIVYTNEKNIPELDNLRYDRQEVIYDLENQGFRLYFKDFPISQTLRSIQELQQKEIVKDFKLVDANLEQVFIEMTRLQYDD